MRSFNEFVKSIDPTFFEAEKCDDEKPIGKKVDKTEKTEKKDKKDKKENPFLKMKEKAEGKEDKVEDKGEKGKKEEKPFPAKKNPFKKKD